MNIVVSMIEPVGSHGGMDYYNEPLCAALVGAGVDCHLYTTNTRKINSNKHTTNVFNGIFERSDKIIIRLFRLIIAVVKSYRLSLRRKAKIFHFHFFAIASLQFLLVLFAKMLGKKVVITCHDVESFVESIESKTLAKITYKLSDAIIAHNEVSRRELVERLSVPYKKITVASSGNYLHVSESSESSAVARNKLGLSSDATLLLFFGQIKATKRLDLLLQSFSDLDAGSSVKLVIAGRPWKTDFAIYNKIIDELGIRDNVILDIRFIPDSDMVNYYAAADFVVLPYARIYQSAVVLMSMSFGKPVIVSNLEGFTDIVSPDSDGLVFESGNRVSLTKNLRKAIDDPTRSQEMGGAALQKMQVAYSWGDHADSLTFIYKGLIE
jgi:glycosyltransferase involved in cell wall biosynthesis